MNQRGFRQEGKDSKEMQKESTMGVEHRMRKEEIGKQFNKETKQRWIFAAGAANKHQ